MFKKIKFKTSNKYRKINMNFKILKIKLLIYTQTKITNILIIYLTTFYKNNKK